MRCIEMCFVLSFSYEEKSLSQAKCFILKTPLYFQLPRPVANYIHCYQNDIGVSKFTFKIHNGVWKYLLSKSRKTIFDLF